MCVYVCVWIDGTSLPILGEREKIEIYFRAPALEIVGLTSTKSTEQADTLETQERVADAA